jgi:phage shock protein B
MSSYAFVLTLVAMSLSFVSFWIVLGVRGKKVTQARSEQDYDLADMSALATSMAERIDILESILDAEIPDWRANNEQT